MPPRCVPSYIPTRVHVGYTPPCQTRDSCAVCTLTGRGVHIHSLVDIPCGAAATASYMAGGTNRSRYCLRPPLLPVSHVVCMVCVPDREGLQSAVRMHPRQRSVSHVFPLNA